MTPTIIVTRAEPGASETAARLEVEGWQAVKSPALIIQSLPAPPAENLPVHSDLIFTSVNGVTAYSSAYTARDYAAWCVGRSTAAAARDAGFQTIYDADGNAADLAKMITVSSGGADRRWLHVANAAAAGDLVSTLCRAGRSASFLALYETKPSDALSLEAHDALAASAPCIVLIHSAKGAASFARLAPSDALHAAMVVAISEAAIAPLSGTHAPAIFCAERPNEDALIDAVRRAVNTL